MTMRVIGLRGCLLLGVLILGPGAGTQAGIIGLSAHLTGLSGGSGDAALVLDTSSGVLVSAVTFSLADSYTLSIADITSGSGGPVLHTLDTSLVAGLTQGSFTDIWTGLSTSDIQALVSNKAYISVVTAQSPNGDLSGQIVVPEPSSLVLGAVAAVALLSAARLRRR